MPAPDIDVCGMLDDLLAERTASAGPTDRELDLTYEDEVSDNEIIAVRYPPRSRHRCTLERGDASFGPDQLRFTSVQMTVTTMSTHDGARGRMAAFASQTDVGPGGIVSIDDERASLAGFLIDDHRSWQVVEHYVVGPYHVGLFVTFHEDDQPIDGPAAVRAIDDIVDQRLDPAEYVVP